MCVVLNFFSYGYGYATFMLCHGYVMSRLCYVSVILCYGYVMLRLCYVMLLQVLFELLRVVLCVEKQDKMWSEVLDREPVSIYIRKKKIQEEEKKRSKTMTMMMI